MSKTTRVLLLIAACIVVLAYVQWGAVRGGAALVGAVLSLLNWLALRWLASRIVDGAASSGDGAASSGPADQGAEAVPNGPHKALVSLLLMGKIGLLIGVVYVLIQHLHIDPIGLAFGLGVLFIGPVAATLVSGGSALHPSAASAAREER